MELGQGETRETQFLGRNTYVQEEFRDMNLF
jgi:hypothetical protein